MKITSLVLIVLNFLFSRSVLAQTVPSSLLNEEACTLSLFKSLDYWSWRFVATGFMAGLHEVPPEKTDSCKICVEFGKNAGNFQSALWSLEKQRQNWVSLSETNKLSNTKKLQLMLQMYQPLQDLSKSTFAILTDENLFGLLDTSIKQLMFTSN